MGVIPLSQIHVALHTTIGRSVGSWGWRRVSIYHPLPRLLNTDIHDILACCVQGCFFKQRVLDCLLWIHSSSNGLAYSVNVTSSARTKQFLLETATKHLFSGLSCDARLWVWLYVIPLINTHAQKHYPPRCTSIVEMNQIAKCIEDLC